MSEARASCQGRGSRRSLRPHWFQLLRTTPPTSPAWGGAVTLPEIDKDSYRGSESESLLVRLHRLGCPITTSRPFWPPLPGQRPFWEASCPHTSSRKEGWPRSMIFPAAAGQESLLACKYRALDPQGGRMFYISVDERRVRSRLIDFLLKLFPPIGTPSARLSP